MPNFLLGIKKTSLQNSRSSRSRSMSQKFFFRDENSGRSHVTFSECSQRPKVGSLITLTIENTKKRRPLPPCVWGIHARRAASRLFVSDELPLKLAPHAQHIDGFHVWRFILVLIITLYLQTCQHELSNNNLCHGATRSLGQSCMIVMSVRSPCRPPLCTLLCKEGHNYTNLRPTYADLRLLPSGICIKMGDASSLDL